MLFAARVKVGAVLYLNNSYKCCVPQGVGTVCDE